MTVVTLQGKARDTLTEHTKKDPMMADPNLVSRGDRESECNARVTNANNQSADVEIKYEVDTKKHLSVPDILPRFSSIKTESEDFTNFDDSPLFAGSYSVMGISDNKNASSKIHTPSSASDESSFSEDGGRSSLSPAAVPSNGPTDYSSTSSASQSGGVS